MAEGLLCRTEMSRCMPLPEVSASWRCGCSLEVEPSRPAPPPTWPHSSMCNAAEGFE